VSNDATYRRCLRSRVLPAVVILIAIYALLRYSDEWMKVVGRFVLALN
jgi:uncharacterized protein YqhQ